MLDDIVNKRRPRTVLSNWRPAGRIRPASRPIVSEKYPKLNDIALRFCSLMGSMCAHVRA